MNVHGVCGMLCVCSVGGCELGHVDLCVWHVVCDKCTCVVCGVYIGCVCGVYELFVWCVCFLQCSGSNLNPHTCTVNLSCWATSGP